MPLLDQMEAAFADAIWATARDVPAGILPARNFGIYRNNVYAGLIKGIEARFPVVRRLVGDDFFTQCARVFVENRPPRSPVLLQYGADFPDFMTTFEPIRQLPYLGPVAQLEWQRHVALHGADARPLDAAALTAISTADMDRLSFDLHPTCHVLASRYPVLSIWQTNTFDAVTQEIAADSPGETVLIVRSSEHVVLMPLTPGADVFVMQLQLGAALGEAAIQAQADSAAFDLAGTLAMLFHVKAFSGFHLIPDNDGK